MPRLLAIVVCCASASAFAADQDATSTHARGLASTCASCHAALSDSPIAPLDGMSEASIAQAMRQFKAGARAGTVMPQLARGYTDEQIDAIARWYAARKR